MHDVAQNHHTATALDKGRRRSHALRTSAAATAASCRSFFRAVWQVVGLSCHWDGPGSTSAIRRTADDGGIKQLDGSFLH
jgi:hypothetical protein